MRKATLEDELLFYNAVTQWALVAGQYPMPVQPDIEGALEHIRHRAEEGNVYVGHGALLIVSEFTPWFGKERVLQEELILKLDEGQPVFLRAVIGFLARLATYREVDYCLAGNTSPDPRLSVLYKGAGFRHVTDIFYKES